MSEQRPPSKNPWFAMSPMQRAVGIVLVVVGGVWFLQGIGVAKGSVMTGSTLWAVLGAVCFVAGVVVLRRKPRTVDKAPEAPTADDPTSTPTDLPD